jgi:hypothetical protein
MPNESGSAALVWKLRINATELEDCDVRFSLQLSSDQQQCADPLEVA